MRSKLFIYGSCVARDIVRVLPGRYSLIHYAARQSWISAASLPLEKPGDVGLGPFSTRSLNGDFTSNVPQLLRGLGRKSDVILIDIASDRHGVYPIAGSFVSNTGELKRSTMLETLDHGDLIEFGTTEHKRLFRQSATKLRRVMTKAGVFDRVLVLNLRFAAEADNGEPMPLARGMTAPEVNDKYEYYYKVLASLGFALTPEPPSELVVANSRHKWGLQQDHFIDEMYHWWADRVDEFVEG